MKIKHFLVVFIVIFAINKSFSQDKKFKIHTVAFYNFENLFDTINDPIVDDEEYLPNKGWTYKNYRKKLDNLSRVLIELGTDENPGNSPVVIGACEIENRRVLEDLVKHPKLINKGYKIIHFDSPDKRGIDVALLYQEKYFTPVSYTNVPLYIYRDADNNGKKGKEDKEKEEITDDNVEADATTKRIYTRDQLLVTGYLEGEEISFIVNHWPSRSGGEKKSSPNREAAGTLNRKIIDSLYKINPKAKILTMGDLNDDPTNKSVKKGIGAVGDKDELKTFGMYNPMEKMLRQGIGTLGYRDAWNIFDQIILSEPLIKANYTSWTYWKANVFKKPYLIQTEGQWKGYPKRNSNGVPGY
ncbi:MAG: endonuclease/exonuclease/phosphatase family protein, partial [Flavobacterium sp.]|nr:endonuclease/exonuclease/phosphatase family protein [Flavobacterium sp.]